MRNKIKQIMNKEEGFTLVELLAVIVILGIIVAIAIPAIGNVTQTAEKNADKAETELIIDAARLYEVEQKKELDSTTGVLVKTLESEGYLQLRGDDKDTSGSVRRATDAERTSGSSTYILVDRD